MHSAVVYYNAHGVPPLEDGQPQKISPFPGEKGEYFTVGQDGDLLTIVGVVRKGSVAVRRAYRVPLWELTCKERQE